MKDLPYKDDSEAGINYFKVPLQNIAKEIIADLSKYDIYDVTYFDLVEANPGFIDIKAINANTLTEMKCIFHESMTDWLEGHNKAVQDAESKVKGTGFSVYAPDLPSAVLCSSLQSSTLRKQKKQAQLEYNLTMDHLSQAYNNNMKSKERQSKTFKGSECSLPFYF